MRPVDAVLIFFAVFGFIGFMGIVADGLTPYGQRLAERLGIARSRWFKVIANEFHWRRMPRKPSVGSPVVCVLPKGERQRVRRQLPRHTWEQE